MNSTLNEWAGRKEQKNKRKRKKFPTAVYPKKSKKEFSLWSNRNPPLFFFSLFPQKNLLYFLLPFTPLALFDLVSKDYSNLPLQLKDHHFLALFTFIHPSFHSFAVLVLVLVLVLLVTTTLHNFPSLHSTPSSFYFLASLQSFSTCLFLPNPPTFLSLFLFLFFFSSVTFSSTATFKMFVLKRDGRQEKVYFDKITARIVKLSYDLDSRFVDPVQIAQKVPSSLSSSLL